MTNPDLGDYVLVYDKSGTIDQLVEIGQISAHRASQTLATISDNTYIEVETDELRKIGQVELDGHLVNVWSIVASPTYVKF